jgi:hypothetical protein
MKTLYYNTLFLKYNKKWVRERVIWKNAYRKLSKLLYIIVKWEKILRRLRMLMLIKLERWRNLLEKVKISCKI